jgi:hypothetical protein
VKVTVIACDPFAGIVPLVNVPLKPVGYVTLVTVRSPLPEFATVSTAAALLPTVTLPKAMLPLSEIADVGVGAVGGSSSPQPAVTNNVAKAIVRYRVRMHERLQSQYQLTPEKRPETIRPPLRLSIFYTHLNNFSIRVQ